MKINEHVSVVGSKMMISADLVCELIKFHDGEKECQAGVILKHGAEEEKITFSSTLSRLGFDLEQKEQIIEWLIDQGKEL